MAYFGSLIYVPMSRLNHLKRQMNEAEHSLNMASLCRKRTKKLHEFRTKTVNIEDNEDADLESLVHLKQGNK